MANSLARYGVDCEVIELYSGPVAAKGEHAVFMRRIG